MSAFRTDCSSCIWNDGIADVKCSLNRYEKFKEKGLVNGEFSHVINRLCTTCRNEQWAERFEKSKDQLYDEITSLFSLLIVDNEKEEGNNTVLNRLKISLSSPQTIAPQKIVFVYLGEADINPINNYLREYVVGKGIEFSITKLDFVYYPRELIDIGVKSINTAYYTVQQNGIKLNENTFFSVYSYIENLLEKVLIIHNVKSRFEEDYHSLTVSTIFHKRVNGNDSMNIEEKAYTETSLENVVYLVKTWPQIYSQLSESNYEYNSINSKL